MNEEKCPCCANHCLKEYLSCGRGISYFNNKNDSYNPTTINEQVIMDLRKCGHLLHHNKNLDINKVLFNFSEDELDKLHDLLTKIHSNIE